MTVRSRTTACAPYDPCSSAEKNVVYTVGASGSERSAAREWSSTATPEPSSIAPGDPRPPPPRSWSAAPSRDASGIES